MNLRHLRYFVALAERLNFTEAAKFLGIAQPPLSVQIRNLEIEMGGALFHRERRKIRLTPLGVLLLEEARPLLEQAGRANARIQDAAAGRVGEIRVAYTQVAFSEKITRRIRKFLRKNRGVRLIATRTAFALSLPECDVLITEALDLLPGAILLEKAFAQIALPPRHRLAEHTEISLADLIGESLILPVFSERSALEKAISQEVDKQGIILNLIDGPRHFLDRMWQVSIGIGMAICSSVDRAELDAVRIPLGGPFREVLIQCVPSPGSRAVALAPFLAAIRE